MLSERHETALVTGGAGLVGSNLVEDLLDAGLKVISLDDLSAGSEQNLVHVRDNPNLTEIVGDITDKEVVSEAMRGVDAVFHQAVSKNTVCMVDPNRDLEVNAGGTLNLLLAAVDRGVQKFVHASTGSVYGRTETFPTTEEAPVAPVSYYGVSKLAAERYVHAFNVLHGLDTSILRYYHVFGPGQDNSDVGGVIPIFIRRALQELPLKIFGDGTQLRAFTYVKDVTAINMACALNPAASSQIYNCASDVRVTITELAETILRLLDRDIGDIEHHDWKPGDIKHFDISNRKVKDELSFDFGYSFDQGLDLTIDSVRKII
jgi:UDP-glucose 4-epimerase